jgi:hypothetical protein
MTINEANALYMGLLTDANRTIGQLHHTILAMQLNLVDLNNQSRYNYNRAMATTRIDSEELRRVMDMQAGGAAAMQLQAGGGRGGAAGGGSYGNYIYPRQ